MTGMTSAAPVLPDGLRLVHSGKVRELYLLGDDRLVLVASDRISAFDRVLDTPIPDKGAVLTQLSTWWFDQLADLAPHHLLSTALPPGCPPDWSGRAVVCERLAMIGVECIARGYLAGSGLASYRATGEVCGIRLPPGLTDGSRLPEVLFTPTTKAPVGAHDAEMTARDVADLVGADVARELAALTVAVYERAAVLAAARGILLADTKIEVGRRPDGTLVLADELLTPDSSRFWPADQWQPGRAQPSYDKQFVRDWLRSPASGWDPGSDEPPPPLPPAIVDATRARYVQAYELLTGQRWS